MYGPSARAEVCAPGVQFSCDFCLFEEIALVTVIVVVVIVVKVTTIEKHSGDIFDFTNED